MDDPQLPIAEHELALKGLRRINRFSGTVTYLARSILKVAKQKNQPHWTLLDIGCANGENLIALHRMLSKHLSIESIGWDISPYAIDSARKLAHQSGYTPRDIRFEQVDALSDS
ncbi:MAG: methyltransferase domain-containing protein, partial [Pirellula sp.]